MLDCGLPFAKIGYGGTPLVVFDGFRVEHRAADGLVLQGMINSYERYTEAGRTVYLLERPIEMPFDYSFNDIRDHYIDGLTEIAELTGADGLDLLGIGAGGMFALAAAAESRGPLRRLVVVAAGPRMSDNGREAAARWQTDAEELKWRRVHREIVALSYTGLTSRVYGTIAWLFPELQGTTDYPWDFTITVREVAHTDLTDRLPNVQVPALFLAGAADRLFSPEAIEHAATLAPCGEARILPAAGHAIIKSRRRTVDNAVLEFFSDRSPPAG
jgi:pimeloyl-ACP methyl ester carboxylesterase